MVSDIDSRHPIIKLADLAGGERTSIGLTGALSLVLSLSRQMSRSVSGRPPSRNPTVGNARS